MSNIYIHEPPTNGKVLLKTSCGDIDIELWSKETPKACRNFVQLCMEGYYDNTIFHRIIKDFIAQGGDPTGTGEGGDSIYGKTFKDEFHSRLKFVRRGLVAMANAGPNDNGSQFFFTLGQCDHLTGKHTIFGKVVGNTIYNLVKLADVQTDGDDRPNFPPTIRSTEVLANPFDDIVPRESKKKELEKDETKSKSKSKATKNFSLLSFGEEAEEDEEEVNVASKQMKTKSKSAHDLTDDPKLSTQAALDVENLPPAKKQRVDETEEITEEDYNEKMKEKIKNKLKKEGKASTVGDKEKGASNSSRREALQQEAEDLKRELLGKKKKERKKDTSEGTDELKNEESTDENADEVKEGQTDMINEFKDQKKKFKHMKKKQAKGTSREEQTLAILAKFQNKLIAANEKTHEEGETEEGSKEISWMSHKFECDSHDIKVKDANVQDADTFDIFDPRNPMNKRKRDNAATKAKVNR
ncbi:spliceosome-associated protein CWC27 homolog [Anneissia japonica]|uniref:spliceosome-associated protein CWC27 homolog n=1 Tax=Anneissia japonica TaxID=1529436 RepID=UPI0014255B46|nr:spliceosome-associated protein CWC27 homolog [Anneissia japonica]